MASSAGEARQDAPTKISFVYSNPTDPAAFEAAYPEQLAMARKLPGLTRLQASRVWPKEDGSPTPAYRLSVLRRLRGGQRRRRRGGAVGRLISADRVNEAWERVLRSDVRYRFVIDNSTL